MRPQGSSEQLEKRRRRAISLLRVGKTYRAVAARVDASLSSVVRWHQAYRKKGRVGLRPKPTPGRPSRLSGRQKQELKRLLLLGPLDAGYSTDLWTLKRIVRVIRKRFGVRYHPGHVWRLLVVDLEWSCQKPERRALQRDEKAIARWKTDTWPGIKKSPEALRPSGLPRRGWFPSHPQRASDLGAGGKDTDPAA